MFFRLRPESAFKRRGRLRRRRFLSRLSFFWGALVLVLMALVVIARADRFLVNSVVVVGNRTVPDFQIAAVVDEALAGNYFLLFPRRNFILYPRREISHRLLAGFLAIAETRLTLPDFKTLTVEVSERRGSFLWCAADECYFMDESGLIFSPAPRFGGQVFPVFSGASSSVMLGWRPIPEDRLRELIAFQERVVSVLGVNSGKNFKIARVLVGDMGDFELQLSDGPVIRFSLGQDLVGALANFQAALQTPELREAFQSPKPPLQYVDLRFPPKVFYKPRSAL